MRAIPRAGAGLLPGRGAEQGGERAAAGRVAGGAVAVRALILGGARSGKSALAEELAATLGGESVLYVATALTDNRDEELERRVLLHRERRPSGWVTLELGGGDLDAVLDSADRWGAILFDSLTLWVSARMLSGEDEEASLGEFERFLDGAMGLETPVVLVSDEVGLGIVPEGVAARAFRDLLGLANQKAAALAEEVHLCVAGIGVRIK